MSQFSDKIQLFSTRLSYVVVREAKETRIAANILIKVLNYHLKVSNKKPTKKELEFLKEHSIDLIKILPMILMFPTPIPYIEIALVLKSLGFNYLLPKEKDLEIPQNEETKQV